MFRAHARANALIRRRVTSVTRAPIDELKLRFRIAGSGGSPQVGQTRMAFTVRAAVRGLAAISERRKIARIAARPTAGTRRQVDDGYASVDRVLIDKIGSKRYLVLDRFGDGDVLYGIINCRHCSLALEFVESTRPQTRGAMPLKWPQNADFAGMPEARLVAARQSSAFSGHGVAGPISLPLPTPEVAPISEVHIGF